MYDEFTPKEKKKMRECIAFFCTLTVCGSIIAIASTLMSGNHMIMFTYGLGLLTRPLTEKVTKLIERK